MFDNFDEFKKLHPAFANLEPDEDGQGRPVGAAASRRGEVLQGEGLDEVSVATDDEPGGSQATRRVASLQREGVMSEARQQRPASIVEKLEQLVAEADTGGRKPGGHRRRRSCSGSRSPGRCSSSGTPRRCRSCSASASSTTPRRARSTRLRAVPRLHRLSRASSRSPRDRVPLLDWVLALAGAFAGAYLFLFYRELATRPGPADHARPRHRRRRHPAAARGDAPRARPADGDRRAASSSSTPSPAPTCPTCCSTRARRSSRFLSHQWLTTEGVFGIALGVSTSFVFLFVLFGTLLDKAGAGN